MTRSFNGAAGFARGSTFVAEVDGVELTRFNGAAGFARGSTEVDLSILIDGFASTGPQASPADRPIGTKFYVLGVPSFNGAAGFARGSTGRIQMEHMYLYRFNGAAGFARGSTLKNG